MNFIIINLMFFIRARPKLIYLCKGQTFILKRAVLFRGGLGSLPTSPYSNPIPFKPASNSNPLSASGSNSLNSRRLFCVHISLCHIDSNVLALAVRLATTHYHAAQNPCHVVITQALPSPKIYS